MRSRHRSTAILKCLATRDANKRVGTYIVVVRTRNEDLNPRTLIKPEPKTRLFLGLLRNLKSQSGVSPFACLADCMLQSGSVGNEPLLGHLLQKINHLLDIKAGRGHSGHGIVRRETAGFGVKKEGREELGIDHRKLNNYQPTPFHKSKKSVSTHIHHRINTFLAQLNTSPLRILPRRQRNLEPQPVALVPVDPVAQREFARCFDNVDIRYRRRRAVLCLVFRECLEDVCEAESVAVGSPEAVSFPACSVWALWLELRPPRGQVGKGRGGGGGGKCPARGVCAEAACAAEPEHFGGEYVACVVVPTFPRAGEAAAEAKCDE